MAENAKKRPMAMFFVLVAFILLTVFLVFFMGIRGLWSFLKWFVIASVFFAITGVVFYVVYWLFFREHKVDITFVNKEKLVQSALVSKPKMVGDLYLSGDKGHQSVRLGRIHGWCRINVYKKKTDVDEDVKGTAEEEVEVVPQDVFVFKSGGFPFSLLEGFKVLRCDPAQHTDLIGDVTINGFSVIKIAEYFYINNEMLDQSKIDYNVLQEAKRGMMFLTLSDMKEIVDQAIGISPKHQKEQQGKFLTKLPQPPVSPPST